MKLLANHSIAVMIAVSILCGVIVFSTSDFPGKGVIAGLSLAGAILSFVRWKGTVDQKLQTVTHRTKTSQAA